MIELGYTTTKTLIVSPGPHGSGKKCEQDNNKALIFTFTPWELGDVCSRT